MNSKITNLRDLLDNISNNMENTDNNQNISKKNDVLKSLEPFQFQINEARKILEENDNEDFKQLLNKIFTPEMYTSLGISKEQAETGCSLNLKMYEEKSKIEDLDNFVELYGEYLTKLKFDDISTKILKRDIQIRISNLNYRLLTFSYRASCGGITELFILLETNDSNTGVSIIYTLDSHTMDKKYFSKVTDMNHNELANIKSQLKYFDS